MDADAPRRNTGVRLAGWGMIDLRSAGVTDKESLIRKLLIAF